MRSRLFNLSLVLALTLSLLGSAVTVTPAQAVITVLYAKPAATGTGDCTTWANACTLQTALTAASSGNQIWVMAGKHTPGAARTDTFTLKTGVAVYGGFAGTETLLTQRNIAANITILSGDIDNDDTNGDGNNIAETTAAIVGNNSYHVVTGSGTTNTAILDGFTITAGQANGLSSPDNRGGGMYNNIGSPSISNSTFSGNSASSGGGGGMYNISSSPAISNSTFSGNSASVEGGGMYNSSSSPSISNSTFSGNSTTGNGGGMYNNNSNPSISNSTFSGNSSSYGAGMYNNINSSPSISNSTFSGNSAGGGGGGMYNASGSPSISNSTFSSNSADVGGGMYNINSSPAIINSTFSGNFTSTLNGGGGMYNHSGSITLKNTIIANSTSGGDCRKVTATINAASSHNLIEATGTEACGMDVNFGGGSNIVGSDPNLGSLTGSPAYFPLNPGSPAINKGNNTDCAAAPVNNASQNGVARPQGITCDIGSFEVSYTNVVLYAKPAATGSGTCLDWANACTLQTALTAASSGNQIWVMAGVHKPGAARTDTFQLKTGVAVYGGFAGTETLLSQRNIATNVTILSGDIDNNDTNGDGNNIAETSADIVSNNSYHVVTGSGTTNTAILDGFTITAGLADAPSSPNNLGGGMYNDGGSPSISNSTFSGNSAGTFGGGMINLNNSSPIISNTTFSGNSASDFGGGIYNDSSSPSISNSTFSGNSAAYGYGGGMGNGNSSNPSISNSTFSGNSATNGGGMFNTSSSPTIKNTIIANSTSGGDCVLDSGSINASSSNNLIESTGTNACNITPTFGGGSNIIGSDPNLGSLTGSPAYFPLNPGSLAIDAGSNANCPSTDQRGANRPRGASCDIGSFEFNSLPTSATFGDVPMSHPYWEDIEILYANGFTAGCSASPLLFCPEATMNRGESAVFMLRGNFGSSYVPPNPPYSPIFADSWASGPWAQKWAQGMLAEGLTAGCSTSPLLYCPWEQMPRLQAAVFGMRLKEGNAYNPPAATGTVFADITDPSLWYAKWAEAAYNSGILPACGMQGGKPLFCPNQLVSRGLGAYMIVRAKNLSMP